MSNTSNKLSPEKSFWGWKLLIIAIILSCIFLGIFYLAMQNEPDYMPNKQQKMGQQHDMSQMNHDNMQSDDMKNMDHMKMERSASEPMHDHHE